MPIRHHGMQNVEQLDSQRDCRHFMQNRHEQMNPVMVWVSGSTHQFHTDNSLLFFTFFFFNSDGCQIGEKQQHSSEDVSIDKTIRNCKNTKSVNQ